MHGKRNFIQWKEKNINKERRRRYKSDEKTKNRMIVACFLQFQNTWKWYKNKIFNNKIKFGSYSIVNHPHENYETAFIHTKRIDTFYTTKILIDIYIVVKIIHWIYTISKKIKFTLNLEKYTYFATISTNLLQTEVAVLQTQRHANKIYFFYSFIPYCWSCLEKSNCLRNTIWCIVFQIKM